MQIKRFLLSKKNIEINSFIWNMAGSMLMAFQSVIMLIILTRVLGLVEAGIFTIAYANANLFLTIGKYGMRNYQVSDIKQEYTFSDYYYSRVITTILMVLFSIIFIVYTGMENHYSLEKSLIILWMCLFKTIDSIEDVYHGLYQQNDRLDIAGKALTIRMLITIVFFGSVLIVTKNLLITLILSTILSCIIFFVLTKICNSPFKNIKPKSKNKEHIKKLLQICFPLFLGTFLAFYIGNAPKYAIDNILNDELQACYGFIAMPVFVIGLLNNFIFNPMLFKMSLLWEQKRTKKFLEMILIQLGIIIGITIICIGGAYLLGIPILSLLYNTDLSNYKIELIILLFGGGFLALSGLLVSIITIIRFQKSISIGYTFVAVLAFVLSTPFVEKYSIMGATILYLILMILLCLIFSILLGYGMLKELKKFK